MKAVIILITLLMFNLSAAFAGEIECKEWLKLSKQIRQVESFSYADSYDDFSNNYLKKPFYSITQKDINLWRSQIKECNFGGFLSTGKKDTASNLYAGLEYIEKKRASFDWGDKDDFFISKFEKRIKKVLDMPDKPSSLREIQNLFEDLDFNDNPRASSKRKQYINNAKKRLSAKYKPIHDNQKYGNCNKKLKNMNISKDDLNKEIHSMNAKVQTLKDALCVAINGKSKISFSKKNSKYILKIKNARNNIHLYFTSYKEDKKLILTNMANAKTKWVVKELTNKNAQYILTNYYGIAKE